MLIPRRARGENANTRHRGFAVESGATRREGRQQEGRCWRGNVILDEALKTVLDDRWKSRKNGV